MELHFRVDLALALNVICMASGSSEKSREGSHCLETSKGNVVQNGESQNIQKSTDGTAFASAQRQGQAGMASLRSSNLKVGSRA